MTDHRGKITCEVLVTEHRGKMSGTLSGGACDALMSACAHVSCREVLDWHDQCADFVLLGIPRSIGMYLKYEWLSAVLSISACRWAGLRVGSCQVPGS